MKSFLTVALLLAIAGCEKQRSATASPKAPPPTISSALIGIYRGTLPCADCSGIDTTLALYAKSPQEFIETSYRMRQIYRGTHDGDRSFEETGTWYLQRGNASDPNATIFQVHPTKGHDIQNFLLVNNDELKLLDREQREIVGPMNLSLRRTADNDFPK